MINLNDHICEKCKKQSRYDRSLHGYLTENYRSVQQKMEADIQKNYYKMVPYYRRQLQRLMYNMTDIEKGIHPHDYLAHHTKVAMVPYEKENM